MREEDVLNKDSTSGIGSYDIMIIPFYDLKNVL